MESSRSVPLHSAVVSAGMATQAWSRRAARDDTAARFDGRCGVMRPDLEGDVVRGDVLVPGVARLDAVVEAPLDVREGRDPDRGCGVQYVAPASTHTAVVERRETCEPRPRARPPPRAPRRIRVTTSDVERGGRGRRVQRDRRRDQSTSAASARENATNRDDDACSGPCRGGHARETSQPSRPPTVPPYHRPAVPPSHRPALPSPPER